MWLEDTWNVITEFVPGANYILNSVISQYPCVGAWSFISFYLSHTSYLCNTKKNLRWCVKQSALWTWLTWLAIKGGYFLSLHSYEFHHNEKAQLLISNSKYWEKRKVYMYFINRLLYASVVHSTLIKGAKLSHCSLGLNIVFHSATGCCMRFWMSQMSLENICIITGHMNTWLVLITYRLIIVKDLNWTKGRK